LGIVGIAELLEQARDRRGRVVAQPVDHPIHVAVARGGLGEVRALLDIDASLMHVGDADGGTLLHRAIVSGAPHDVVALLLDRGADLHAFHAATCGLIDALRDVDVKSPISVSALRVALQDRDQSVRRTAIAALLTAGDASALPLAEAALLRSDGDTWPDFLTSLRVTISMDLDVNAATIPTLGRLLTRTTQKRACGVVGAGARTLAACSWAVSGTARRS
jgi:hypothetical protein